LWYYWAQGLAQSARNNPDGARISLRLMDAALERIKQIADPVPRQFYVARMELQAEVDNNFADLQKSAVEQADMLYTEPPPYPRPILENVGRLALQMRNFPAAESAYRELLSREPGNGRALLGLSRALTGLGKTAEAESAASEFRKAWAKADPEFRSLLR
jgi:tetratricopeptide (TPR) repeat protein